MPAALSRIIALFIKAAVFVLCGFLVLWWAYSMSEQGKDGFPANPEAFSLTLKMSLIMTACASVIWFVSPLIHKQRRWIGLAIRTAFRNRGYSRCLWGCRGCMEE